MRWRIDALASPAGALNSRTIEELVALVAERLEGVGGHAFEELVAILYEERSRSRAFLGVPVLCGVWLGPTPWEPR